MVCGVVGSKGDDGLRERELPVYFGSKVCGGSVCGYVKIVQGVVFFCFCRELQFWV